MKISIVLLILTFAVSVSAQAPQSDNLVNAIKALQHEIESTRAEVKALRVQQERQAQQQARRERRGEQPRTTAKKQPPAKKKRDEVGRLISERESRLEAVELTLAELAGATPEERKRAIASIVVERQILQEKVKKANQSWGCRLLRIGCIGRK